MPPSPILLALAGFQKSYTTSLAYFLVQHGLCELLWPQHKEPHLFSRHEFGGLCLLPGRPVLDGSQCTIGHPLALDRLQAFNTRLILSYRHPYDRAFSAYRMHRLFMTSHDMTDMVYREFHRGSPRAMHYRGANDTTFDEIFADILGPAEYRRTEKYLLQEAEYLRSMSFAERLAYEWDFHDRRGDFPYYSILLNSLYARPTAWALQRFPAAHILPLTLHPGMESEMLAHTIAHLIEQPPPQQVARFPHAFNLADQGLLQDATHVDPAVRARYRDRFNADIDALEHSLNAHGCDLKLFDARHLRVD